jgi:murein DD-endopeptidase MepM/ murein hydrolase activator NlpD
MKPTRKTPAVEATVVRAAWLSPAFVAAIVAILGLGLAGWAMWCHNHLERPSMASDPVPALALSAEMQGLDENLHEFMENIRSGRRLEREARYLAGLDPEFVGPHERPGDPELLAPALCLQDQGLARSLVITGLHLEEAVSKIGVLKDSYACILDGLTAQAAAWECIPSINPVDCARMTSHFGTRQDPFTGLRDQHEGLDLAAPAGSPVRSAASGTVARAGRLSGYGKLVEIDHGNGILTRYAHNSRIAVRVGEQVLRGQLLGFVGSTGRASAPHLHYEVLVNGSPVDPSSYLLAGSILTE